MLNNKRFYLSKSFVLGSALAFLLHSFTGDKNKAPAKMVCDYISHHIDLITSELDSLEKGLKNEQFRHYEKARQHYKLIEFGIEFAFPFYAKYYLNGPAIKKSELEYGNRLFEPHGFQLLETHLYGNSAILTEAQLRFELTLMKDVLRQLKVKVNSTIPKNETVFEMLKLECYRIASLGLSGYDCTVNKTAVNRLRLYEE